MDQSTNGLVLICEDEENRSERLRDELTKLPELAAYNVHRLNKGEFVEAVGVLEDRRQAARKHSSASATDTVFDRAHILIIDYDLFEYDEREYWVGESVAYLARCFSRCGLIVALNQFGDNTFDLSLRGHPESFADINIGGSQLGQPGLWRWPWDGFRPWSWAILPKAARDFQVRVGDLSDAMDRSILDFFEVPGLVRETLPREAIEFLDAEAVTTAEFNRTTFTSFVRDSTNGLRGKDAEWNADGLRRIAAARISKWLERHVLPGQEVLVDGPHLASRYPSLLTGDYEYVADWNAATNVVNGVTPALDPGSLDKHRFARRHWLSRPAWYWQPLTRDPAIAEVADPWSKSDVPFLFCEDVSAFLPPDAVREFVADLPSPYTRRYVVNPDSLSAPSYRVQLQDVDYRPRVRLAL